MAKAYSRDGVFQRKDRQGWWMGYTECGVRKKEKLVGVYTRGQAVKALGEKVAKIARDERMGVKSASDITTAALMERYRRYQKTHLKPSTFLRLEGMLKAIVDRLPERAKDIRRATISEYVATRSEEVAAGTIRKEVGAIQHALNLAVEEWELFSENRASGAKLPKLPEGRTRYLTPTELKAALEAAPEWMRAPIALAAFTGMRRGELLSLRWIDVDLNGRRLYLRETKNGSLRVLVLNDLAVQVIASLPAGGPSERVLSGVDGLKLSVYCKRLFESVGIEDASFHSLRHTHASLLAMEGVSLHTIGQMLGHRTPRMTTRYAHLSPEYVAISAAKLDRVFGDVLPVNTERKGLQLVPPASPVPTEESPLPVKMLN